MGTLLEDMCAADWARTRAATDAAAEAAWWVSKTRILAELAEYGILPPREAADQAAAAADHLIPRQQQGGEW